MLSKRKNFKLSLCEQEIECDKKEQLYDICGALASELEVDVAQIKNGVILFDKKTSRIYIIVHPTRHQKGHVTTIMITKKEMKKLVEPFAQQCCDLLNK